MSARFAVEGLEVRRGTRAVLRIPALAAEAGEAVGIVGPNGAGKSTLLSLLAGLEVPEIGRVRIGDADAAELGARRRVSLLPQDAPMLSGTVLQNVERPLALRGVARAERRRRAMERLEKMALGGLASRDSRQLSGGEARRVALARALVTDPEALLLDEPFNGVDDPARERLLEAIRESMHGTQRTLVLVTQRRDEAIRLASRLVVLVDGEVRQSGRTEDVLAHPVDPVIARFLGLENVLRAAVVDASADGVLVDVHGVRLRIASAATLTPGALAWVVFAPEQVELRPPDDHSKASARNVLRARVVSLTPREGRVDVRLDAGFELVAAVTRAAVEELALAPGAAVVAALKATALHLVAA